MTSTYRSMQVDEPGAAMHLVEKNLPEPPAGHVRVTIEASAVCHTDSMFVEGQFPGSSFPLVAGPRG